MIKYYLLMAWIFFRIVKILCKNIYFCCNKVPFNVNCIHSWLLTVIHEYKKKIIIIFQRKQHPIQSKVVLNDTALEQGRNVNYLSYCIIYEYNEDLISEVIHFWILQRNNKSSEMEILKGHNLKFRKYSCSSIIVILF